jgi:hypothetical protein
MPRRRRRVLENPVPQMSVAEAGAIMDRIRAAAPGTPPRTVIEEILHVTEPGPQPPGPPYPPPPEASRTNFGELRRRLQEATDRELARRGRERPIQMHYTGATAREMTRRASDPAPDPFSLRCACPNHPPRRRCPRRWLEVRVEHGPGCLCRIVSGQPGTWTTQYFRMPSSAPVTPTLNIDWSGSTATPITATSLGGNWAALATSMGNDPETR